MLIMSEQPRVTINSPTHASWFLFQFKKKTREQHRRVLPSDMWRRAVLWIVDCVSEESAVSALVVEDYPE
jgi:hypothetical protein